MGNVSTKNPDLTPYQAKVLNVARSGRAAVFFEEQDGWALQDLVNLGLVTCELGYRRAFGINYSTPGLREVEVEDIPGWWVTPTAKGRDWTA